MIRPACSRGIRLAALGLACLAASGCSTTSQAYRTPDLPADELATVVNHTDPLLAGTTSIRLAAVDGAEVRGDFVGSTRIRPGRHWLLLVEQAERFNFNRLDSTTCSLELLLQAGHSYRFGRRYSSIPWSQQGGRVLYSGVIAGSEKAPGGKYRPLRMPVECVYGRSHMCRTEADCSDGKACRHKQGFQFGLCGESPK